MVEVVEGEVGLLHQHNWHQRKDMELRVHFSNAYKVAKYLCPMNSNQASYLLLSLLGVLKGRLLLT